MKTHDGSVDNSARQRKWGKMARISEIILGLEILAQYCPEGESTHLGSAEQDVLYLYGPKIDGNVSPDDAQALVGLGWYFDEKNPLWACFV